MMLASAVLLSMVGLVAADMVRFESNTSPVGDLMALSLRASGECEVGTPCADFCINIGAQCCSQSEGTYCKIGYACQRDGCCPLGQTCVGPPSHCEGKRVKCGMSCVPEGSQCCSQTTGNFCNAGTSCVGTTKCDGSQRPGSGSGSGSASGTTTSDIFGGVTTTQGSSATSTYSLSSSTNTADSSSGSDSGSSSATGSASGSGSGSGSGDSTTTASSASPTDDKKNPPPSPTGAGAINSPSILLGLLAVVLPLL